MNNNKQFINTVDPDTADILRKYGFKELPKSGNKYVFINEPNKIQFSSQDMQMSYTDVLTF